MNQETEKIVPWTGQTSNRNTTAPREIYHIILSPFSLPFLPPRISRSSTESGMRGDGFWHVSGPIFKELRADNEARGPLMKGPVAIGPLINSFSGSLIWIQAGLCTPRTPFLLPSSSSRVRVATHRYADNTRVRRISRRSGERTDGRTDGRRLVLRTVGATNLNTHVDACEDCTYAASLPSHDASPDTQ